jgi:hypothetical protein
MRLTPVLACVGIVCLGVVTAKPATALQASNLDLVTQTARQAVREAMADLQLPEQENGTTASLIAVGSAATHASNWLFEHLLTEDLLSRGLEATVDGFGDGDALTKLSWRVVDLGIRGQSGLLGGTVTRRCRVVIRLELHHAGELVWSADGHAEQQDQIPKGELDALQHSRFGFAKTDLEQRTWGKFVEPLIITTILGSLVYLFFSNR